MNKTIIASLIGLLSANSYATDKTLSTDEVIITANGFQNKESDTTYASEIHTAKQIEASGATTLYDYLAQQTSLNILSNFGNKATPSINLRGYGAENGYQNVVIILDGQRLNTIDLNPQLIGAIPINNIERIEISKGSGSVIYGDGATAGTIQIYTKSKTGVTVSASAGNFGTESGYISAGLSEKYFDISANANHESNDGYSQTDKTDHKDEYTSNTQNIKLKIKPTEDLSFRLEGTTSRNDLRYPNSMSLTQLESDPSQNGKPASAYTHQHIDSDQWRLGFSYAITPELKIVATHYQENRISKFTGFTADSDYRSNDITLNFENDSLNAIVGLQNFEGERNDGSSKTSKNNFGYFAQAEYHMDALTISTGARHEKVSYHNNPTGDVAASGEHDLNAWDLGANYRLSPKFSLFANYNKSFEAADIDRSFVFDTNTNTTVFSGFINPAKVRTFNIGLNHIEANNKLKVSWFYARLNDEIYLVPDFIDPSFKNTNIDKSHKYGMELQDYFKFTDKLNASLIYNFTRAIIDSENDGGGTFNGKNLPGVPKHTIVANINYEFFEHATFNINHTWRSRAYAYNDFQNNFSQKQQAYESTNLALNYQYQNMNFFSSVNNIFEKTNSIQIRDNAIYPVDFARTWKVGMRVDF